MTKPAPKTATCQEPGCGVEFTYGGSGKGGRPAKHCPAHRRARGVERHPEDIRARDQAKRKLKRAGASREKVAATEHDVMRLAAGLAMVPHDDRRAARTVGLELDDDELAALAARARAEHPEIIAGDPSGVVRLVNGALALVTTNLIAGYAQISPRDLPHVTRALSQTRESLVGGVKRLDYQTITLEVLGADGKPIALGPPPPTVH